MLRVTIRSTIKVLLLRKIPTNHHTKQLRIHLWCLCRWWWGVCDVSKFCAHRHSTEETIPRKMCFWIWLNFGGKTGIPKKKRTRQPNLVYRRAPKRALLVEKALSLVTRHAVRFLLRARLSSRATHVPHHNEHQFCDFSAIKPRELGKQKYGTAHTSPFRRKRRCKNVIAWFDTSAPAG